MSGESWTSGEVDLDALADYTAGVLDGAEAATIANLVATDPRWGSAHTALLTSVTAVRRDLRAAAAAPARMPDDVAARLDRALAAEAGRGGVVVSLDAARSRRRRIATAVVGTAAAAVAVLGGLSIAAQLNFGGQAGTADVAPAAEGGAPGRAEAPLPPAAPSFSSAGGPVLLVSGRDYTAQTVSVLTAGAPAAAPESAGKTAMPDAAFGDAARGAVGGALARLAPPAALQECLDAINASYPGVARTVDYARYEGVPALLAAVQQGTSLMIVIVGPDCGLADADVIATVPA